MQEEYNKKIKEINNLNNQITEFKMKIEETTHKHK